MAKHQKQFSDGLQSARFVVPTKTRLLLATASVLALQAVITAGPAYADQCVTSISTTANPNAVQTTTFNTIFGFTVPTGASYFSAINPSIV